jgi:hypothetical protein
MPVENIAQLKCLGLFFGELQKICCQGAVEAERAAPT